MKKVGRNSPVQSEFLLPGGPYAGISDSLDADTDSGHVLASEKAGEADSRQRGF